jgi:sugar phosphate isomerase/epimerase
MQHTRRTFIKNISLSSVAMTVLPQSVLTTAKKKQLLGLQLYSVRDDMRKDPLRTLQQLAAIGYKNVEHAGYTNRKFYGYAPAEFKKILNDLGMKMPSGHTSLSGQHWNETANDFTDAWKQTIEDAAIAGQQYVISPWLEEANYKTEDSLKKFMNVFNQCGELCKKNGMMYGYHNHDFEYTKKFGDKTLYDLILEYTDPELVTQQLDTGNLYHTGARAQELIKNYPGRFLSMHVKDEIKVDKGEMGSNYESAILGAGVVGIEEVLALAKSTGGTRHFIIEQESYQGKAPVDCMRENYKRMQGWGF